MTTVASVDYDAKRIYLSATTVGVPLDTLDVYRDVRALRRTTEAHRKYKPMIVAGGNVQKTPTTFTQAYVQLLYGCYIVPYNVAQSLLVIRETFSDDGRSGVSCFARGTLTAEVDIDVQVSPVEIRTVATGGGLTTEQSQMLMELYQLEGLKAESPLVVNGDTNRRTSGGIAQSVVTAGNVTTVTRL